METGYDTYWIGLHKYKDKYSENEYTIPEYKLYLLHYTNNYAYFRLFSIKYNAEIGDTNNAIYTEITELKSVNKKKLKYSLRKDKTNWLGEIPCFKTSCNSHYMDGAYKITLPFNLECGSHSLPIRPTLEEDNMDMTENVIYLGNTSFDIVEKQILEQKQKLEQPQEEDCICEKCNPNEELSEKSKMREEEMNDIMKDLNVLLDKFEGKEQINLIQTFVNDRLDLNLPDSMILNILFCKMKNNIKDNE